MNLDALDTSLFDTPQGAILDGPLVLVDPVGDGQTVVETPMYRYRLWRSIPEVEGFVQDKGEVAFVMLNPSTADAIKNDRTIDTCLALAGRWGYRRLVVVNLFAYRTKSPKELRKVKDRERAVGPLNSLYIDHAARNSDLVVCAWGTHGAFHGRAEEVFTQLWYSCQKLPHYLKLSKHGVPEHPLYKPYTTTPKRFSISIAGLPRPETEYCVAE